MSVSLHLSLIPYTHGWSCDANNCGVLVDQNAVRALYVQMLFSSGHVTSRPSSSVGAHNGQSFSTSGTGASAYAPRRVHITNRRNQPATAGVGYLIVPARIEERRRQSQSITCCSHEQGIMLCVSKSQLSACNTIGRPEFASHCACASVVVIVCARAHTQSCIHHIVRRCILSRRKRAETTTHRRRWACSGRHCCELVNSARTDGIIKSNKSHTHCALKGDCIECVLATHKRSCERHLSLMSTLCNRLRIKALTFPPLQASHWSTHPTRD